MVLVSKLFCQSFNLRRQRQCFFQLGWPHLGETLVAHVNKVVSAGRAGLVMITYHYSKGDPARGCAGSRVPQRVRSAEPPNSS